MINKLVKAIENLKKIESTIIIGIDGLGGSGKSTFADILKAKLTNYDVIVFHIDDFIFPKSIRYNQNYEEWECYYNLQWRYNYFVNEVLLPIKNKVKYKSIEIYNREDDAYVSKEFLFSDKSIIIVEGVFLQRTELNGLFDYMIHIDVPEEIRLKRVIQRDLYIGSEQDIITKYKIRYFPAEHRYFEEYKPKEKADIFISN